MASFVESDVLRALPSFMTECTPLHSSLIRITLEYCYNYIQLMKSHKSYQQSPFRFESYSTILVTLANLDKCALSQVETSSLFGRKDERVYSNVDQLIVHQGSVVMAKRGSRYLAFIDALERPKYFGLNYFDQELNEVFRTDTGLWIRLGESHFIGVQFTGRYFAETNRQTLLGASNEDLFAFSNSYMFHLSMDRQEVCMRCCKTFGILDMIWFPDLDPLANVQLAANDTFILVAQEGSGIHQYDLKTKAFRFQLVPLLHSIVLQQRDLYVRCLDGSLCIFEVSELKLHTTLFLGEQFPHEKWKWDASDKGALYFCADPHRVYELQKVQLLKYVDRA